MDEVWLGLRLLVLITVANSAPILAKKLAGRRWSQPLDGGARFIDGRPLLGKSKTWRGLAAAVVACTVAAPLLGFNADHGALAGLLAMAGDAISSFIKRRRGLEPSAQAFGLDQVPEALLPLLALRPGLELSWVLVGGVTLAFLLLETPAARLSHRLGLRDRPY